ncbi:MAG TPA: MBL fold metallo-hydrolase [Syntrophales bacterium]|nr:MBL fold metallo-hydrolase [Syntrophales bacterium]HPI55855.1 MBL fold metallo-hydrolase [Syntrophales bacterium]HPN23654.1 MBL fold metallo-hydrolase [Syntrophales bacterium]HQM27821.1 MBL fold metallo-hydrolase [Syntrophales bacterium]
MILETKGRIAEGLFSIGDKDIPTWLLMSGTPALFDAGITFMGPRYLADLREHLGDVQRLGWLFLTHSHFDHAGSAPYLKRHIPNLKVAAGASAAETFKKENAVRLIRSLSRDYEDKFREIIGSENVFFDTLTVDRILQDGEEVDLGGGWIARVIATPGHTRDGLSYYIPRIKGLIIGEAAGVPDRNGVIHPEFLASYRDYATSLKKLTQLDVDIVMIGHHFVFTGEDARDYLRISLDRTGVFRRRIEAYLNEAGGDREAVVRRVYQEDYEGTGAIQQDARAFLLNLAAKVKAVAENR